MDAIGRKNFEEAMKCYRKVCEDDRRNTSGFVSLAAAHSSTLLAYIEILNERVNDLEDKLKC